MPRRNHPKRKSPDPESFEVRPQTGASPIPAPAGWHALRHHGGDPGREYKCPRCERMFPAGTQHVVAWCDDEPDRRRHWHSSCWDAAQREGLNRYRF